MKWKLTKNDIKNLSIVISMMGVLSVYGFNCSPQAFKMDDTESLELTNGGSIIPANPVYNTATPLPQAILTSEQVYHSIMGLTGQSANPTNGQTQEFNRRAGTFPVSSGVELVNGPMLLALASFSGEACNGLVGTEQNMAAASRKYFGDVNFNGPVANLDAVAYASMITKMTNSFWGRVPSSEEMTAFNTYRTEYIAAIPAGQEAATAQTRALAVSTCAAVLSSFDVFTY